eukprot:gene1488-32873_t
MAEPPSRDPRAPRTPVMAEPPPLLGTRAPRITVLAGAPPSYGPSAPQDHDPLFDGEPPLQEPQRPLRIPVWRTPTSRDPAPPGPCYAEPPLLGAQRPPEHCNCGPPPLLGTQRPQDCNDGAPPSRAPVAPQDPF